MGYACPPLTLTYSQLYARCRRLASALSRAGVARFDCVATLSYNVPAQLEACYGVLMAGAVINAINFRLQTHEVAFILRHCEAKVPVSALSHSYTHNCR